MTEIESAIALACRAHAGQLDKAGQPYILHPLRLMLKFRGEFERTVAVLHDVVEDGGVTLEELRRAGFADEIIEAVDCLTRRENELYEHFIMRLSTNELATKVKIEDIKDNLDVVRLPLLNEDDLQRLLKYHKAIRALEGL